MPSDLDILRGSNTNAPPPSANKRRNVLEDLGTLSDSNVGPGPGPVGTAVSDVIAKFRNELRAAAPSMTMAEVDRVTKLAEQLVKDAADAAEGAQAARENASDGPDRSESELDAVRSHRELRESVALAPNDIEGGRLTPTAAAAMLCESLGFTPTALQLKCLVNTAPADRKDVARMFRNQRKR